MSVDLSAYAWCSAELSYGDCVLLGPRAIILGFKKFQHWEIQVWEMITHDVVGVYRKGHSLKTLFEDYGPDFTQTPLQVAKHLKGYYQTFMRAFPETQKAIEDFINTHTEDPPVTTRTSAGNALCRSDKHCQTCIVIEQDPTAVRYIPLMPGRPLQLVLTPDVEGFLKKYEIAEPGYPIDKAARIYLEFARIIGAEKAVLDALAPYTKIHGAAREEAQSRLDAFKAEAEAQAERDLIKDAKDAKKKAKAAKDPRQQDLPW